MADILIRGVEMPERDEFLCVFWDGSIALLDADYGFYPVRPIDCAKAVSLPEGHGRLIDADAFKAMCLSATKEAKPDFIRHEDWLKSCAITMSFCRDIDERPTIVPAEGGTDDEHS